MDDTDLGKLVGEVTVTYTVKELLARIEARQIGAEAERKAQIEALSAKIDDLESSRDRIIGFAFAIGAISGGAAGWLANLLTVAA